MEKKVSVIYISEEPNMKKKIALIQMDVALGKPEENFAHAENLLTRAAESGADILVLPELWNTGFLPKPHEALVSMADVAGKETISLCGAIAKKYGVNIVAGSVTVREGDSLVNRAHIFDRGGALIETYDKIHAFTLVGEEKHFKGGTKTVRFLLDDIPCSAAICYDVRFCELIRAEALSGVDLFFLPAAWPLLRLYHWEILNKARAVENQMYLCAVNESGYAGKTKYAGNSLLLSPWGEEILRLPEEETIQTGEIDLDTIRDIRESINVFRDRKPELYHLS